MRTLQAFLRNSGSWTQTAADYISTSTPCGAASAGSRNSPVEQPLRRAHHDYVTALQAAAETPGYPPVAARRALDVFLATAATLLAPALEMLEHLAGRHVVVPQRHLNTVPMAALPMGDRRLIDVLASISTVPSLGLLTDLLDQEPTTTRIRRSG